ncbi:Hin recombinase [Sphingomonas carotinifaciens]|uniref:Hin recombinase n=1 Tax=Sphingomonas carotinifaciens TaxID=1166323 RepID=A0A6N8LXD0_9SPHN|nr:Hin recombinase [Sphingomonas carotinifaciens]MBB4087595.1 DNA invertase Pin-like site-specific DNA recombinase [Sphingomonas carotinifaciens]MWC45680.1 Hin recombinase [Sphingomonas carotinifaciens]
MSKTVAFLAECQGSATIVDQQAAMRPDAHVIIAGRHSFNKFGELLSRAGIRLEAGDRVAVYDLNCITISTGTLIRIIGRLLRDGIAFEIVSADIVIDPAPGDKLHALLRALDGHHRYLHGLKTHPETASRGRKPLLDPADLSSIRRQLEEAGATATSVAKARGVSRSTLFNFLERHDPSRRSEQGDRGGEPPVPAR